MSTRALILLTLGFLFFVLPSATEFFVDWLWFDEVGYRSVYMTSIWARTEPSGAT